MKGLFDPQRGHCCFTFFFSFSVLQNLCCSTGKAKEQDSGLSVSNDIWIDVFPSICKLFKDLGSCLSYNLMDMKSNPCSCLRKELQISVEQAQKPQGGNALGMFEEQNRRGWRDGSAISSTYCSCRGTECSCHIMWITTSCNSSSK